MAARWMGCDGKVAGRARAKGIDPALTLPEAPQDCLGDGVLLAITQTLHVSKAVGMFIPGVPVNRNHYFRL